MGCTFELCLIKGSSEVGIVNEVSCSKEHPMAQQHLTPTDSSDCAPTQAQNFPTTLTNH